MIKTKQSRGATDTPEAPAALRAMETEQLWALYEENCRGEGKSEAVDIRNALIEKHLPLVRIIALKLLQALPRSVELDDLLSAGVFGLMDTIRGFDPDRGVRFKTYCSTRIRGAILDQLRTEDWVPRLVRIKAGRISRELARLSGEFGREPTHAELADALGMDHCALIEELDAARPRTIHPLSDFWNENEDGEVVTCDGILEDREGDIPVDDLERRDTMRGLTRSLSNKERFIIEQYYEVGHTMREIGEMLSLTESRVCQIHSSVVARLRQTLIK
ncbi:MAG: FliA/WhiG family RNA polymerase sigma factor [Planctomycetota bacterium]|nr:FliA/WhiG family RNA polymerase sigma factor [Planctomycetota bacterium]MDP6990508.1 FliA/WhiG family RNA polymerase sigma factor [Planctomycetota bacterium]